MKFLNSWSLTLLSDGLENLNWFNYEDGCLGLKIDKNLKMTL